MPTGSLDALYTKVAKKVLRESLHVKKGDSITVETWDNGLPFARLAVAEARKMGCMAMILYEDEWAYVEGVRKAPKEVVGTMGKNEYGLLAGTDAYVFIPGPVIGGYSRTLKPEDRSRSTRYNSSWYEAAEKAGLKGVRLSFGYIGKDLAALLGKKVEDVVRAQLEGALVDFEDIGRSGADISSSLSDGEEAELRTGQASLGFTLRGELEVEDGVVGERDMKTGNNMTYIPPGYVAKEVDPDSANGRVALTDSLTKFGVIPRATLEFEDGKLVGWESSDRASLKKAFDAVPPGDRRLELLGIGLNPRFRYGIGQDRFVKGSVTLSGFGFTGVAKKGTLKVGGAKMLTNGTLRSA